MPLSTLHANRYTRYIICYDIADDRRRYHLVKCLEDYGERVQYSVFEVLAGSETIDALKVKIDNIVDYEEDSIFIYLLDANSEAQIIRKGIRRYHIPECKQFMIV